MNRRVSNKADFNSFIRNHQGDGLRAVDIETLQVNVGSRCNMFCAHCHVNAGPDGGAMMDRTVAGLILRVVGENRIRTVDITGGAPELNPHFRYLVDEAWKAGSHVIVRTNLTVLLEQEMKGLPEFLFARNVEIIASFPGYSENGVDEIRGTGTFSKGLKVLKRLNEVGFGTGDGQPALNLMFNPKDASLPGEPRILEKDFRRVLSADHDIQFTRLYALTNMPVGRFRESLRKNGTLQSYTEMLRRSFNASTVDGLMCRRQINVGWDGSLYDCDFNQMLGVGLSIPNPKHVNNFDYPTLKTRSISTGEHCFGCTAGWGSS